MLLPHVSDSSLSRASPPHSSLRLLSHSPRHRTTPLHLTRPFTLGHCGGPSKADRPCVCAGGCGCDVSQLRAIVLRPSGERADRRPPRLHSPPPVSTEHRARDTSSRLLGVGPRVSRLGSRDPRGRRAESGFRCSLWARRETAAWQGSRATLVRKIRHARKRQTGPTTACVTYLVCLGPDRI